MLYKLKSFHVTFKAASTVHSEEQVLTQVLGDKRCYLEAFWSKISLFVFFIVVKHTYNKKVITLNIFNVPFSEWHEVSSHYCATITTFHLQNSFIFLNWNYIHFLIPLPPFPPLSTPAPGNTHFFNCGFLSQKCGFSEFEESPKVWVDLEIS